MENQLAVPGDGGRSPTRHETKTPHRRLVARLDCRIERRCSAGDLLSDRRP